MLKKHATHVLSLLVAVTLFCLAPIDASYAGTFRVTLLGSGSPVLNPERFSQSTLIEAGNQKLLFDLGRGVSIRLAQRNIPLGEIDASFITHMHSDHLVGLTDFWLTGWLPSAYAGRKVPMELYGPKGTKEMAGHLTEAFSEDIRIRELDQKLDPAGVQIHAHDISTGPVYEKNGLKVTAFETNHGPLIKPTFGYTITYQGRKVVLPSDSRYDKRIVDQAKGADLLIHEVAAIDPALMKEYPHFKKVTAHHTTPEDAGRIFEKSQPRLAAYSHIIALYKGMGVHTPTRAIEKRTRKTYDGPLVIGEDLMSFEIGDDIIVHNAAGDTVLLIEH